MKYCEQFHDLLIQFGLPVKKKSALPPHSPCNFLTLTWFKSMQDMHNYNLNVQKSETELKLSEIKRRNSIWWNKNSVETSVLSKREHKSCGKSHLLYNVSLMTPSPAWDRCLCIMVLIKCRLSVINASISTLKQSSICKFSLCLSAL